MVGLRQTYDVALPCGACLWILSFDSPRPRYKAPFLPHVSALIGTVGLLLAYSSASSQSYSTFWSHLKMRMKVQIR
jgi:hypothetical protein